MALTRISSFITANTGVTSGSYGGATQHAVVTVNTEGQITYAANVTPSIANTQITGTITSTQLSSTGVTAGTYGGSTNIPVIVVNAAGQLTSASNTTITIPPSTAIFANSGQLTANSSTGNVLIGLATTGVTATTYGNTSSYPVITVDSYGRITSASNVAVSTTISLAGGTGTGSVSGGGTLTFTGGTAISTSVSGSTVTINNTGVTSITGGTGVTASASTGSVTVSIPQAISTSSSVQFGSFGVGTAASGTTGEIRATNNITAYYSDDRLKNRLGEISNALDKVKTLSGFYYEANETAQALGYKPIREVGISAQDVQKIMPEVVAPAPIDDKYLTVRYERLIPLLIEAIKELNVQIENIKSEVNK